MAIGPLSRLWASNPQLQGYIQRYPNSFFAKQMGAAAPMSTAGSNNSIPSFAAGGMLGDNGRPIRPGEPMPPDYGMPVDDGMPQMGHDAQPEMGGAQIEQEAARLMRSHPDVMQQIQGMLAQAMQSGQLTSDELNLAVQLAKTALANPDAYPQVRQFAIQNGLGTEAEIPQRMDRGMMLALVVAGKALQASGGKPQAQGNAMQGQAPSDGGLLPSYKEGGMTKGGLAKLHGEEYVATKAAVLYHGKKTYDKLEEQARAPKDGSTGS